MMNEETKASLNRFLKQREERIKNMTLAEARDIISSTYGHSDMRMESDKALQMLLDCADKTLDQQSCKDKGEISDGHHTFNQLYYQRAILFATIVNQNKDKAWKSFKHSDGHYCFDEDGEMFIVGIDTPKGSYTYHYHKKYWDYFNCKELECGKVWDGHTEEDVTRLLSLEQHPCEDCVSREAVKELVVKEFVNPQDGMEEWRNAVNDVVEEILHNIETMPSVTPQPFINKPCVSERVCREDKIQVLDKITAEIEKERTFQRVMDEYDIATGLRKSLEIINKYKTESEDK